MVNARYLRINPQYWHGWPCLRTDFMGCSAHEGNGMLQCYSTLLIISRHLWLLCHDVFCKQWRLTEQCLEIGRPKIVQTWVRKSNNHSILTCFFTFVFTANPTAPTPLKSYIFDFCLTPSSKSCSPRDNDPIIFVTGSRCSERHFQFTRGKDGLLRHACSGKLVCPENGGTHNGAKIVVSRTCKVADSKLVRTVGKSKEMHIQEFQLIAFFFLMASCFVCLCTW